ncbi:hypothetical protein HY798_02155 [Candidatus Falkowbacteria bacterium]|nr:hypothetical protein [Candidatus Falkowbacteria bacterium]
MFNLFNFFKKNKEKGGPGKEATEKKEEKKIIDADLSKDIIIHVMPERFRVVHAKAGKAKKTGLLILIGGFLFFVVVSGALYYYLFGPGAEKKPKPVPVSAPAQKETKSAPKPTATSTVSEETKKATTTPSFSGLNLSQATTTAEIATTTPASGTGYAPGRDIDSDNLTDKEEELLGTAVNNPDSDGDGYSDFTEISNLYNPSTYASARLIGNPRVKKYANTAFGYSLLYPAAWTISSLGGNDSIMFKSADDQFIQVIAQPNPDRQTIENWYFEQFKVSADESKRLTGNGWQGIKNNNGLIVYLTDKKNNYIFTITYNPVSATALDYGSILTMMIKSFAITE